MTFRIMSWDAEKQEWFVYKAGMDQGEAYRLLGEVRKVDEKSYLEPDDE